jgi:hypothetical protein
VEMRPEQRPPPLLNLEKNKPTLNDLLQPKKSNSPYLKA